jgi:hypothetical protein
VRPKDQQTTQRIGTGAAAGRCTGGTGGEEAASAELQGQQRAENKRRPAKVAAGEEGCRAGVQQPEKTTTTCQTKDFRGTSCAF